MSRVITRRAAASGLAAIAAAARAARGEPSALLEAARREGSRPGMSRNWIPRRPTVRPSVHRRISRHHRRGDPHHRAGRVSATDARHQEPHAALRRVQRHRHLAHAGTEGTAELTRFTPDNRTAMRAPFTAQSDAGWYYVTNAGRWVLTATATGSPPRRRRKPGPICSIRGGRGRSRSPIRRSAALPVFGRWRCGNSMAGSSSRRWQRTIRASAARRRIP